MSDPLSFFAGEDSSDSESEEERVPASLKNEDKKTCDNTAADKLPSPSTLFATVGKPSFLKDTKNRHINWDNFVKNEVGTEHSTIHITDDGSYAAIPPPSDDSTGQSKPVYSSLSSAIAGTYNKESAGEISAPPVRYTKPEDVDPKYRAVGEVSAGSGNISSDSQKVGTKRSSNGGEDESSKKMKTDNFRKKEKRKRDMGQSSRGKSYVEEEKRLLRQQFGTDEVMS